MKKRIIVGNIIISVCLFGIFGIAVDSGYSIGKDRATAYYENYQSERDALIGSMLNGTNHSYSYAVKSVDDYLN